MAVLQGFALISVVVAVGWLLAHTGLFGRAEQRMLAKLTFWVGSPCLLFTVVAQADVRVIFSGFLVATVVSVLLASGAYLVLARLFWRRPAGHVVMGGMSSSYVNANNLGVPIALYVLGDASWAAPILLMQLLVLQPAWLAALDATRHGRISWVRLLRSQVTNPMTIGTLLGLAVSLTGVRLPQVLLDPITLIAGLAVPCMLIAFGISLRLSPLPGGEGNRAELVAVVLIKLALMPAVAWLVAGPVLGLEPAMVLAAGVMATLPTAQNVYVLSVAYGRGEGIARDSVFLTTVLAMPAMLLVTSVLGGA
jgi:malonate transporter and related proteins